MRSTYSTWRKSRHWSTHFLYFALDIAIINSLILYRKRTGQSKYSHLQFRLDIVKELVRRSGPSSKRPPVSGVTDMHLPIVSAKSSGCVLCYKNTGKTQKTVFKCSTCNVFLHCNSHHNCYAEYHGMHVEAPVVRGDESDNEE